MLTNRSFGRLMSSFHGQKIEDYFIQKCGVFEPLAHQFSSQRSIFLCFVNRSGSTILASEASALGFCGKPNHHLNYEFFNSDFVSEYCDENKISNFSEYVASVSEEYKSSLGVFFSKGSVDQLAWLVRVGVIDKFFQNNLILALTRRNIIRQAISLSIAQQTSKWTSLHKVEDVNPNYNPQQILEIVDFILESNQTAALFYDLIKTKVVHFVYEDFIDNLDEIKNALEAMTGLKALEKGERTLDVKQQGDQINVDWEVKIRSDIDSFFLAIGQRSIENVKNEGP